MAFALFIGHTCFKNHTFFFFRELQIHFGDPSIQTTGLSMGDLNMFCESLLKDWEQKSSAEDKKEPEEVEKINLRQRKTPIRQKRSYNRKSSQPVPAYFRDLVYQKNQSSETFHLYCSSPREFRVSSDAVFACEGLRYCKKNENLEKYIMRGMECQIAHKVNKGKERICKF